MCSSKIRWSDIHLAECRQIFEEAFLILHMEREIRSIRIFRRMFPAACGFLQRQEFLYQAIARIFQDLRDPARVLFGQEGRSLRFYDQIQSQVGNRSRQALDRKSVV